MWEGFRSWQNFQKWQQRVFPFGCGLIITRDVWGQMRTKQKGNNGKGRERWKLRLLLSGCERHWNEKAMTDGMKWERKHTEVCWWSTYEAAWRWAMRNECPSKDALVRGSEERATEPANWNCAGTGMECRTTERWVRWLAATRQVGRLFSIYEIWS